MQRFLYPIVVLLTFSLSPALRLLAQHPYRPLSQHGLYWMAQYETSGGSDPEDCLLMDGDTTVDGKVYTKLYRCSMGLFALVRDDTAQKQVWFRYHANHSFSPGCAANDEFLLMDLGMDMGDSTFLCYRHPAGAPCYVEMSSKDSYFDGIERTVISLLDSFPDVFGNPIQGFNWTEGIGIGGLPLPDSGRAGQNTDGKLQLFTLNFPVNYTACGHWPGATIDTLRGFMQGIINGQVPELAATVRVWPNPVSEWLHVAGPRVLPGSRYAIIAPNGQTVALGNLPADGAIGVGHLSPGLYLLRVQTPGQEKMLHTTFSR